MTWKVPLRVALASKKNSSACRISTTSIIMRFCLLQAKKAHHARAGTSSLAHNHRTKIPMPISLRSPIRWHCKVRISYRTRSVLPRQLESFQSFASLVQQDIEDRKTDLHVAAKLVETIVWLEGQPVPSWLITRGHLSTEASRKLCLSPETMESLCPTRASLTWPTSIISHWR